MAGSSEPAFLILDMNLELLLHYFATAPFFASKSQALTLAYAFGNCRDNTDIFIGDYFVYQVSRSAFRCNDMFFPKRIHNC